MNQTVLHVPSFEGQYKTGLIFSMIEGLKPGQEFRIVCDQSPLDLEMMLREAHLDNLTWSVEHSRPDRWQLTIKKALNQNPGDTHGGK